MNFREDVQTYVGLIREGKLVEKSKPNYTFELVVLTSLFFMWGFITCLNDILIPHLKALFSLSYTQVMLVQFCFFTAYFVVSIPAGYLIEKIGYKKGIVVGLLVAGLGCFLFYPSASYSSYNLFLTALAILASGITILQVAANPYVTVLGPVESASLRLNLTQAFNSLGTTVAPIFGSVFILSAVSSNSAESVQTPYIFLALTLVVLALIFAFIKLPNILETKEEEEAHLAERSSAWKYPHLVLGGIAIFVYVGAEVSIGSFLVNFLEQPEIGNMTVADAAKYISVYWGGAMVGRFIGAFGMKYIKPNKLLGINAFMAALLVLLAVVSSGNIAMWSILAIGFFNSIMFPTIFALGVAGLGKHKGQGSGILCMSIVGGAILPLIQGLLADKIGIHRGLLLPIPCYLFIAYFALVGFKKSEWCKKA